MGVLCAGGSGFRHTISDAAAMTNLTTEMHLSELPLHASRLVYEHRTCQIVPAINAKLNLLRGKKIGLARRKIAFVAVHDAVPVVQRVSACWHSRIDVEVFSDEFKASKCSQGMAIDLHFLEPRVLTDRCWRSKNRRGDQRLRSSGATGFLCGGREAQVHQCWW